MVDVVPISTDTRFGCYAMTCTKEYVAVDLTNRSTRTVEVRVVTFGKHFGSRIEIEPIRVGPQSTVRAPVPPEIYEGEERPRRLTWAMDEPKRDNSMSRVIDAEYVDEP
jgi:hypothetical protein